MENLKMSFSLVSHVHRTQNLVDQFIYEKCKENEPRSFFDIEIFQALNQQGLLHMTLPTIDGAPGMSVLDMADVIRIIGSVSGGIATSIIGNILGTAPVLNFGSKALVKKITDESRKGFLLWSFAMTEKSVGSDIKNIQTKAVATENGYILSGEKNYITNANFSKYLSVFAQTYDRQGNHKGISCFFVESDKPGFYRQDPLQKFVFKESNTGNLIFDQYFIPQENLLGSEGQGIKILQTCISQSKTLFAAVGVGLAERALMLTETYLQKTHRFGKTLMEQKVIPHLLVRLHAETQAAWLLTQKAAKTWDDHKIAISESSIAKLMAGQCATRVTGQCVELFGAPGLMSENEIHRLYKESKGVEIIEGSSRVQEIIIINQMYRSNPSSNLREKL